MFEAGLPPDVATPLHRLAAEADSRDQAADGSEQPEGGPAEDSPNQPAPKPLTAYVKPAGGTRAKYEDPSLTTDLFVAATPAQLKSALPLLMANERITAEDPITRDFCNLEAIRLMETDDRIKPGILETSNELELVLHYDSLLDGLNSVVNFGR